MNERNKIEQLIEMILELDEVERIEFIAGMKEKVANWKERCISQFQWIEKLENLGFKQ